MSVRTVRSRDGTAIAYERSGSGPPLVLVDGALCHRRFGPMPQLAPLCARDFTVFAYDRRGRGDSGNTLPWAVEREVEDLAAVLAEAGGRASVLGVSSGAGLALEAARAGLAIEKLVLYEAPFIVDASRPPLTDEDLRELERLLAEGKRGAAVKLFMRIVGTPAPFVFVMSLLPVWKKLASVAHTLPYDLAIVGGEQRGRPLCAERWSHVQVPTLVAVGGKSPIWMQSGMRALAAALPGARLRTLPGQTHMVKPQVLAPLLVEFCQG
jgi:pimeloyl-ACP methyl ester carboxylesterase